MMIFHIIRHKPDCLVYRYLWMKISLCAPLLNRIILHTSHNFNSTWSHVDIKLHGYLKSGLHKEALLLFDNVRNNCTPLSIPLLPLILTLYLEKGPKNDGLSHILCYLHSTSRHPSTGLTPLLINRAVLQRDLQSLINVLDSCFQNGVSIRPSGFTQAVNYLLTLEHEYETAYRYVCTYLSAGSNIEEDLLLNICEEHLFSPTFPLEQSIMSILTHYSELGKCIRNKRVFETLAHSLKQTNQFSKVRRTYLIDEKCQACGSLISGITLSPHIYSCLEEEVREAIQRMYHNQKIKNSPEVSRFDRKVEEIIDSLSDTSDEGVVVVVDCLSVGTPIDTGWTEVYSEQINCDTLLRLVECIEQEYNPTFVVLLMRRVLFWRYEAELEMQFLKERASLILINQSSVHSLFSLLAAMQLKSRALLLTADKFHNIKFNFSPHLHTAITGWFLRHCLRFDITGIDPVLYKSSQSLWQPHFSEEGLHVPMTSNDWICAKK